MSLQQRAPAPRQEGQQSLQQAMHPEGERVGGALRRPAHLVHVIHRLDTGGMENGLVNLVNRLPIDRYRHTILSLTTAGPIARRIGAPNTQVRCLERAPGPLSRDLPRIWRVFRELRPDVVHTRNIGTLEAQLAAWAAAVPVRVHGEHGWEVHDLGEGSQSLLRTRRRLRRLVHRQVALSEATARYLRERVGVPADQVTSIMNGVDTLRFHPRPTSVAFSAASGISVASGSLDRQTHARHAHPLKAFGAPEWPAATPVIGYVGRLADVKHPLLLLQAFELLTIDPSLPRTGDADAPRLAIIGNGPMLTEVRRWLEDHGLANRVWLAGDRADVADLLPLIDIHALPSLAEGICNTLLEAMACGIPSVATAVGGNPELVDDARSGTLVRTDDAAAMASALRRYLRDPALRRTHGDAARKRATEHFGIDAMVRNYDDLYSGLLASRGLRRLPELQTN